ncbi:LOW QUALITY PROTEIN: hypothetical protein RJ640_029938, partial [Escallonia rubra]
YIPETFRSPISLVTLDLSHNNLHGLILKSLEALSHLTYSNISFNNEEIQSGGPFENFTQANLLRRMKLWFYGESMPFRNDSYKSAKTLGYLDSQQAATSVPVRGQNNGLPTNSLYEGAKKKRNSNSNSVVGRNFSHKHMLGVFLVSASPTTSKSHSRMEKAICFLFLVEAVFFIQSIRMSCSAPLRSVTSITTDQSALLALKARVVTLDPHGLFVTNWSSATPVCDWVGVICSRRHNRVAALNLSNMGLVGTIPPDIGNISFLASLDISNNSFSGSLPKRWLICVG